MASQAGPPEHGIPKGAREVAGDKLVPTYYESVLKKSYSDTGKKVKKALFRTIVIGVKTTAIRDRGQAELKYRKDSWRFTANVQNEGIGDQKLLREAIRVGGFLLKAGQACGEWTGE